MDIGRAYTFITSDPKWISKILIGAAIALVPIVNLALYGYALEVLKRVYYREDLSLPEWDDFGDYVIRGLLATVGIMIWQLPLLILICPVVIAGIAANSAWVVVLGIACLTPIAILVSVVVGQVVVARYALSGEFASMFEIGAVIAEARRGAGLLLLCALAYVFASLVGIVAGFLTCAIGFFFITPWLTLAQAHLLGQAYRQVRNVAPRAASAF